MIEEKKPLNNYYLKFILLQKDVQAQILSLTSGTSASHNRIRSNSLEDVIIPVPYKGTPVYKKLDSLVKKYIKYNKELYEVEESIFKVEEDLNSIFS